jgi:hypothetical protein
MTDQPATPPRAVATAEQYTTALGHARAALAGACAGIPRQALAEAVDAVLAAVGTLPPPPAAACGPTPMGTGCSAGWTPTMLRTTATTPASGSGATATPRRYPRAPDPAPAHDAAPARALPAADSGPAAG